MNERLVERLRQAGVSVDAGQLGAISAYFDLLSRWNATINLSGFSLETPSDEAIDRLFVEPSAAAAFFPDAGTWFDLGSGGGSPAIPIKILRPGLQLFMVESKSRKAAFLREAARELDLARVRVEECRFEALASREDLQASAQIVSARAVRPDDEFMRVASYLLRADGKLFLFASEPASDDLEAFALEAVHKLPAGSRSFLNVFTRREAASSS